MERVLSLDTLRMSDIARELGIPAVVGTGDATADGAGDRQRVAESGHGGGDVAVPGEECRLMRIAETRPAMAHPHASPAVHSASCTTKPASLARRT